jgi:hypothetical protein
LKKVNVFARNFVAKEINNGVCWGLKKKKVVEHL